ncbi:putative C2 domain, phosphoribosyltransferase [Medicago truncatula]|uniref:Putative C2 domain, phosphoribosyltransferase n=1 Tax=Medicago truncatula TaxID=3880 RepID=A0A396HHL4_MEDTR|nr:protein QUIRKY [Medicago truncatula]RHN50775.1 putative C2 domain, phosphoribosyltransferase [Medicago truncatula]
MATVRKLIVEVIDAQNLAPKDGHGTSSPYIVIDFHGQRRKTRTLVRDLNPVWNETLSFNVGERNEIFGDVLELDVYHDMKHGPTRRENSLGRVRLSSTQFVKKGEEALIYYELKKKSLFNMVQGKVGLKIYYVDEEIPPPPPPVPVPENPPAPSSEPPSGKVEESPPPPSELEKVEPPPSDQPSGAPPPPSEAGPQPKAEGEQEPKVEPEPVPEQIPVQEEVVDPMDANPPEAFEMAAASISRSNSEVRFSGINGPHPQPIRRSASTASFTSEASMDSMLIERSTFDLVEKMHYLFIRVVKARYLPTNGNPIVKISVSGHDVNSKPARKTTTFEWNQTFAFARDTHDSSPILEITVWDPQTIEENRSLLGGVCFDVNEIPVRDPPDSSLAPQWYRMEGGGAQHGDLMIATWIGTQADESFADAWKSDTTNHVNSKAKVYQSPKLWYLRVTILEAQDITPLTPTLKESWFHFQIRAQIGFQVLKTKTTVTKNGIVSWNEDLLFVAAEPLTVSDFIVFSLENRQHKAPVTMGVVKIPLTAVERRVDDRNVGSRWFTFDDPNDEKRSGYKGRLHLRLCFDGGYHVMDEAAHVTSDYRPTARQLWKPPVGTIELGIIGCKNLIPMKTVNGKSSTDGYCVAKYGNKWVRTRTVSDNLEPKWNEQYTWKVFDPSTVLTIGVFDSFSVFESDNSKTEMTNESTRPDFRIGKVRIRISTLQTGRVYKNTYPLLVLTHGGLKKMGEIEIAIRFVRTVQRLDFLHVYSQPMLPLMHHIKPLGVVHQEVLRNTAVKMVAGHLSRSEPPLRKEVVFYMLDADSHNFSIRKVRANWCRIINVVAGLIEIVRWIEDTRGWKNPTATILVHALLVMLVWFPDLIIPTLAFYVFAVGAWNYRFRARDPLPHFDPKISLADVVDREELDEEFDIVPSTRSYEAVRARYDKLRTLGARVQTVLGDLATQGERVQALVTWRDPCATGIFVFLCLVVAMILYLVPSKMVAMACGFYYLRHPIFRDRLPSPGLNFFRRLPSLSDRIM